MKMEKTKIRKSACVYCGITIFDLMHEGATAVFEIKGINMAVLHSCDVVNVEFKEVN